MNKTQFKYGFLAVLTLMNVYWGYYPPSAKYLSHSVYDSKHTESSLFNRVLVINSFLLICLTIEFWYLCEHTMRGQEYMIYICVIALVSVNRCLAFLLHPINVQYLNRMARFTYILMLAPIFLLVVIYLSNRTDKKVSNKQLLKN